MDREQLKYGTDHTSVKVKQVPGGNSSINLGWEPQQKSKYSRPAASKQDYSNSQSRGQTYEDEYYSSKPKASGRGGNNRINESEYRRTDYEQREEYSRDAYKGNSRGYDDYEDDYARSDGYSRDPYSANSRPDYKSDSYSKPRAQDYSRGEPRGDSRGDPYARGSDRNEGYGKTTDPYSRNNEAYSRGTDSYSRGTDSYGRSQDGYSRAGDSYSRPGDSYSRDQYSRDAGREAGRGYERDTYERDTYDRDYGRENYSQNKKNYDPGYEDDYEPRNTRNNERRNYPEDDYEPGAKGKPKTSVKVKNPPGGQSSFIFG
jgi:hypothetical protein